ncbi:MAG: LA2681 family HEPN domain-containing protein [Candidatus Aphodocola sp.]
MDRIKLSKENLIEIVNGISDKTKTEFYYQSALEDKIEANSHIELVVFLVTLVRYFYDKLFVSKGINPYLFFNLKEINDNKEYWDYYELLRKTNLEIAYSLINDETTDDKLLVGFSEIQSLFYFISNNYLSCLLTCNNAIYRDNENSLCNFLKASIIEICYINKISQNTKIALLNYQFELLSKCKVDEILFDKQIFNKIFKKVIERRKKLSTSEKEIKLTECFDDSVLTNESIFYLNNGLFLNPLNNYGRFLDVVFEDMETLPTSEKNKKMFDEIVEDYKFCRNKLYQYFEEKSINKREMTSIYSYIYSTFDKIAFVLKKEFDLNIDDDKVGFTKNGLFDCKLNKQDKTFSSLRNNNIVPLYLIMKQVREKQKISNALMIGTFEFNELRNTIEHKSLLLVDESKLKRNSIELLSKAREAILYSFMLLYSIDRNFNNDSISCIFTTYIEALDYMVKQKGDD